MKKTKKPELLEVVEVDFDRENDCPVLGFSDPEGVLGDNMGVAVEKDGKTTIGDSCSLANGEGGRDLTGSTRIRVLNAYRRWLDVELHRVSALLEKERR